MARLARVVLPGVAHHITQRGNRRLPVFFGDDDRRLYLGLLREGCAAANVRCLRGEVTARRARGEPTVPMKLERERATNPVLRADDPALQARRASQGAVDDLDAHLGAHLTDDLAHPEANLAVEHLEPALGRPDEMVAMVKSRVATGGVADSLWLKPVSD